MAPPLRLHVTDYQNDTRWRFRLDDGHGAFLADHEVNLGYSREVFAWRDLPGHLRRYRPVHPEEELLSSMGEWLGRVALGRVGEALAKQLAPALTV